MRRALLRRVQFTVLGAGVLVILAAQIFDPVAYRWEALRENLYWEDDATFNTSSLALVLAIVGWMVAAWSAVTAKPVSVARWLGTATAGVAVLNWVLSLAAGVGCMSAWCPSPAGPVVANGHVFTGLLVVAGLVYRATPRLVAAVPQDTRFGVSSG